MTNASKQDNPTPIKLGNLKPKLLEEAFEKEISLHFLIKKILAAHLISNGKVKKEDILFTARNGGNIVIKQLT